MSFWDSLGEAVKESSPGAIYKQQSDSRTTRVGMRQETKRDPVAAQSKSDTLGQLAEVYGKIHASASSVGSGILDKFGIDAPSENEQQISLLQAQAASAAAAASTAPPPPPAKDNTMLYVGAGVGGLVLLGGIAYAATR